MNFEILKKEFDTLYAQLNDGEVPEWASPGLTHAELSSVEGRLGVKLPQVLKHAFFAFGRIEYDSPFYLKPALIKRMQKLLVSASSNDLEEDCLPDDIGFQRVYSPLEWGASDEWIEMRAVLDNILEDNLYAIDPKQRVAVDCNMEWLKHKRFILIGSVYGGWLFINLIDESASNYGALYIALDDVSPCYLMFKVADDYGSFLENMKSSIQRAIKSGEY